MIIQEDSSRSEKPLAPTEQIRLLIERLAFQTNRVAKSPGPEPVHDLRVAIRRLDQAITIYKIHLPRKSVKRIRKQLKAVLSAAGAVRDCDIATKILAKTMQPGAAALNRHVRQLRSDHERSLLLELRTLSLRTRILKWCDSLSLNAPPSDLNVQTVRTIAMESLPKLARRFFGAGEEAAGHGSGKELHSLRIRAKHFRYTLELFVPIYGSIAQDLVREVKSVQSILGAMNDYRTVLSMATDIGCGKKLRAALKRSERRKILQFNEVWAERFSRPTTTRWTRSLQMGAEAWGLAPKPIAVNAAWHRTVLPKTG
jgi:CHAD domain-containing protein